MGSYSPRAEELDRHASKEQCGSRNQQGTNRRLQKDTGDVCKVRRPAGDPFHKQSDRERRRIEGGEREAQSATGFVLDTTGDFIAVQSAVFGAPLTYKDLIYGAGAPSTGPKDRVGREKGAKNPLLAAAPSR